MLNEEYFKILDLIDSNTSYKEIQNQYNAEIFNLESVTYEDFENTDLLPYKNEIFNADVSPNIISNNEELIVYTVDEIYEPIQLSFSDVQQEINSTLNNNKAIDIRENIVSELGSLGREDFSTFADKYNYLSVESFVNVKSNTSILPREVINELFIKELNSTSLIAAVDDYYLISVDEINLPSDEMVASLMEEFRSLSLDQVNNKLFAIINDELYSNIRNDLKIGVN